MRTLLISLLLVFTTLTAFADEQAPTPQPAPTPRASTETQLFQVVLLRASRAGAEDTEGLPKSAEKALADIRDFLPFKRYRLLDSAIVRLAYGMGAQIAMTPYEVRFTYERKDGKLSIWAFSVIHAKKKEPLAEGVTPEAIKPLIATSFTMDRGETVVVGSSKIDGDDALIVLLTALPGR